MQQDGPEDYLVYFCELVPIYLYVLIYIIYLAEDINPLLTMEGDIRITGQLKKLENDAISATERDVLSDPKSRWDGKVIPYQFDQTAGKASYHSCISFLKFSIYNETSLEWTDDIL